MNVELCEHPIGAHVFIRTCDEGCCDLYKCLDCGYSFWVEVPE